MAAALGLDIGEKRIGVACADLEVRLATPVTTVLNDDDLVKNLQVVCTERGVTELVVGLPRGLDGQETSQTMYARTQGELLATKLSLPVYFVDEALTSHQAEEELVSTGKPYSKGDIDALAATYILQDHLTSL